MQKNVSCTYQLSSEDIKEAIEQYMKTKGECVDIKSMEVVNTKREVPLGIYDVDYIYTFGGLRIKAEMV